MASRVPPINPYPGLPYRGDPSHRPTGLALPPDRMPLFHGRRPLKRWRYVGVFGAQAMICAAHVRVGGLRQSFWAVWDRERRELRERTSGGAGGIDLADGVLTVRRRGVDIALTLEPVRRQRSRSSARTARATSGRASSGRRRAERWRSTATPTPSPRPR